MGRGRRFACSASEAREQYSNLEREAFFVHLVPSLTEIPWISNPREVLSQEEFDWHQRIPNGTGLRASFNMMPDILRYMIHRGFVVKTDSMPLYLKGQAQWQRDAAHFLGEKLHHNPDSAEFIKEYWGHGTSLFYRFYFALNNPKRVHKLGRVLDTSGADIKAYLYDVVVPNISPVKGVAA